MPRRATRLTVLLCLLAASLGLLWHRTAVRAAMYQAELPPLAGKAAPELPTGTRTLDDEPIALGALRGHPTLVHFWTFGCSNCRHMLPSYDAWQARWGGRGLAIVGVHTPETDEEQAIRRVRAFVKERGTKWRVIFDPDMAIWRRFQVSAWPTIFLVDAAGTVQQVWVGDDHAAEIEAALAAQMR